MLTIYELKARALFFQSQNRRAFSSMAFRDNILRTYHHQVLTRFLAILKVDPPSLEQLEGFLKENWNLIKGTSVSYTAIPRDGLTLLLCELAEYVAHKKAADDSSPIQLLMPGIVISPSRDTRACIADVSLDPSTQPIDSLLSFTQGHDGLLRYRNDSGVFYYDINTVTQTCTPVPSQMASERLGALFSEISSIDEAELLRPNSLQEKEMMSIVGHPLRGTYPNFATLDLPEVLSTHVLDDAGVSLLPIRLFTEFNHSGRAGVFENPYYDYEAVGCQPYVSEAEKKRLIAHCSLTQAIADAQKHLDFLLNDTSNLLGHLRLLCQHLRFNSVGSAGGIGAEENAGAGTYAAIAAFSDYYSLLSGSTQTSIPISVKAEIDKLLSLSSDSSININATRNLDTCIATRRRQLEDAIRGHEEALSAIGMLEGASHSHLIAEAKSHLDTATTELRTSLNNHRELDGHDALGLKLHLLQHLGIAFSIQSKRDIETLQTFSPQEIEELMKIQNVQQQFVEHIETLEYLVLFILQTSPACLVPLLTIIAPKITQCMLQTPKDLANLLMILDVERVNIVCNALKMELSRIIASGEGLNMVLRDLSPAQRLPVFAAIQELLPNLIKDADDLNKMMIYLDKDQRTTIFAAIEALLPNLIKNAYDLGRVMQYLNIEQQMSVLAAIQALLPNLLKDADDLGRVMGYLNADQRTTVLAAIQELLPGLIKNAKDLGRVMGYLNPDQRTTLFTAIQTLLPDMIKDGSDIWYIIKHLDTEERDIVFRLIQGQLSTIIKAGDELAVLEYFTPEQRMLAFSAIEEQLLEMIKSSRDVGGIMSYITPEQRTTVFATIQHLLPGLIKDCNDLINVIKYLDRTQQSIVFAATHEKWPALIKNGYDLRDLIAHFSLDEGRFILSVINEHLPSIFSSSALHFLERDKRTLLFSSVKQRLPCIIKTQEDLDDMRAWLTPAEQSDPIFELSSKLLLIEKCRVGNSDLLLDTYLTDMKDRIAKTTTPEAMAVIQTEAHALFIAVSAYQNRVVTEQIASFRASISRFSIGLKRKADQLEQAVLRCPPGERDALLERSEIRVILGAHVCDMLIDAHPRSQAAEVVDSQVEALKGQIAALRGGITCYSVGKNRKAIALQNALDECPADQRSTVLRLPSVQKILGPQVCNALIECCEKNTLILRSNRLIVH